MRGILNRFLLVFVISIFTGSVAFAETIKQKVTFGKPVVVSGTVVRVGTYDAIFDDQTNELIIKQGKKVIAKAPARLEERSGKQGAFISREEGNQNVLLTVLFKKNQATITNNAANASTAP
jgi:hypothetical protein